MNKAYFGGALKPLNSYLEGDPSLSLAGDRRRLRRKGCRHLFALGFMLVVVLSAGAPLFGIGVSISGQSRSDVLKIGYIETAFYDLRLKDAQVALEMWGSSLINRKESPLSKVDALIIPSFALLQNAVSKDELDVVILGSVDYLMLKDRNLIEPVMAPNSRNDCLQNYLILVRKDRGINELAQLKNSRLLLALGGEGELPRIWLDTLLLKEGLGKSPLFFKETKAVEKASQAVLPVFFGQADACLATARSFDSLRELNPQIGNELVALKTSPRLLRGLICFRKSRAETEKKRTLDTMLKVHEDPQGQQILLLFHEERLVPFQDAYLDSAKNLLLEYEKLTAKYGNQNKESHR